MNAWWAGNEPTTWTDSPTASPPGSRSVTRLAPAVTGTVGPHRVDPSAVTIPNRTSASEVVAWVKRTVAEVGSSDSPKNHDSVWPERRDGRGPG